jgi:hypothetical protein
MYVRLGFAVAVNMDPDILLVDEVLAVGDELFQRKCLDKIREFQREGRTIIFVTHSADMVKYMCNRVAVLHEGLRVAWGEPAEAVRSYREHLLLRKAYTQEAAELIAVMGESEGPVDNTSGGPRRDMRIRIASVHFDYQRVGGKEKEFALSGEPLTIRIGYTATELVEDVVAVVAVYDREGRMLFAWRSDFFGGFAGPLEGSGEIVFNYDQIPLIDGTYSVSIGLHSQDNLTVFDWQDQRYNLTVATPSSISGVVYAPAKVSVIDAAGQVISDGPEVATYQLDRSS